MRKLLVSLLMIVPPVFGQLVGGPPAGSPRGEDSGNYNVVNSWETGYRFYSVDGNVGKYRSDVNYRNGLRLIGGTLSVHSRDGKGSWIDELLLDVRGLGNDPYQFSSFRIQKNSLYRYDLLWRSNEYFNPALTIADGYHAMDTNRQLQDHDVTLFPQSMLRIRAGYSRNTQNGPGLWTGQWFDSRGDEYPFMVNVRRLQQEYRVGADLEWRRLKLSVTRGWELFKDDTTSRLTTPSAGANPEDSNTLEFLRRDEPMHGNTPYWRAHLRFEAPAGISLQGRFTYSDGVRDFFYDELTTGTDRFGSARNRQILLSGAGRRPVTTGYFTAIWHPSEKWTFSNQTGYSNTRMEGTGRYSELNNGTAGLVEIPFQFLGLRTVSNTSEASWQPVKFAGVFGSYHFSERQIRSLEIEDLQTTTPATPSEQTNRLNVGTAGIRLQPIKPLRIFLSGELGRNDKPFYPTSDKDYHGLAARAQYRAGRLTASAGFKSFYNTNSTSLFLHSSRGRNWSANAGWNANSTVNFDAGYNYNHIDTLTGLAYFANFNLVESDRSLYLSNLHTFHVTAQANIRRKVELMAGFVQTVDTAGTNDVRADVAANPDTRALFLSAQVFPLTYQSPMARISFVLHPKIRWNFAWQYYDYHERLLQYQDYSAHTGYVSLSYSF